MRSGLETGAAWPSALSRDRNRLIGACSKLDLENRELLSLRLKVEEYHMNVFFKTY